MDGSLHHSERGKTTFTQRSLTTIVRFLLFTVIYALQLLMHILNFTLGFCKQEKRLCTHTVFRATCNFRHHLGLKHILQSYKETTIRTFWTKQKSKRCHEDRIENFSICAIGLDQSQSNSHYSSSGVQ